MPDGPDPDRVHDVADLAAELALLRVRAARGTGRPSVSLAELTRRMGLPPTSKSTVHSYATGRTLAPAEALDAMVIALGATPDEQRAWAEAWFRVAAARHGARPVVRQPAPVDPDTPRSRAAARVAGVVAVVGLLAVGADVPVPLPAAVDHPHRAEFLTKLLNVATGKCLSRNGAFTHPDDSERVGQDVYQWECAGSDNPGHRVVVAPVAGGWQIRSSSRADLCLAADGAPGVEHHYRLCDPDDDRQLWSIRGHAPSSLAIRNRDTDLCLAHQGGDPSTEISLRQRDCAIGDEARWRVEDYPPLNDDRCADRAGVGLRNHETDLVVAGVTLRAAGPTAHGCAMSVERAGRCLTAAGWHGCDRGQRWVAGPVGEADGRLWVRLHSAADVSRCLEAGPAPRLAPCDGEWNQQWHVEGP